MLKNSNVPHLTIAQLNAYKTLVSEAKRSLKPESEKVKSKYIESELETTSDIDKDKVRKRLTAMLGDEGILYGDHKLAYLSEDGSLRTFCVTDVFADKSLYDKKRIFEPTESDYGDGRPVAILNASGPRPSVYSFAHGGKKYHLVRESLDQAGNLCSRALYNPHKSTDMGNAERFQRLAGKKAIFVENMGWFMWDGRRYVYNPMGVKELYKSLVISELYEEVVSKAKEHDTIGVEDLAKWAKRSESDKNIVSALNSAASMPDFFVKSEMLDADQMVLNVENGTIDLRTGELRKHDPDDLITKLAPVIFDPDAQAPTWKRVLDRIFSNNQEMIDFFKRAFGYSLTGMINEQCWFILHGAGANGKSLTINCLKEMIGDYSGPAAPELLMASRSGSDRHPTELADLKGRRMVVCQETEEGRRLSEVLVKQMTGGDAIKARLMRQDFFEFLPTHKIWLATNHRPIIKDTTESTWRRIRLIPFEIVIPEAERDQKLPEKLKKEWPGILNWAVEGCLEWQHSGLNPPTKIMNATKDYRGDQDLLAKFISEECYLHQSARTKLSDLYEAYTTWCEKNHEQTKTNNAFSRALAERSFEKEVCGITYYKGIGLKINVKTSLPDPEYEKILTEKKLKDIQCEKSKEHTISELKDDPEQTKH